MVVTQPGTQQYMVHQFKTFVGANTIATIECEARSSLAPSLSTVYLQIFNYVSLLWDTIDFISLGQADINFVLNKTIRGLSDYKDGSNVITCRVYQLAI